MNRYARITTRKGRFILDLNEKDTRRVITVLREGESLGQYEKIAEIPFAPRPDVIKAVTRIVSYLEAAHELQSVDGLRLLTKSLEPQKDETTPAPPAKKGSVNRVKPKRVKPKKRGRVSVWA